MSSFSEDIRLILEDVCFNVAPNLPKINPANSSASNSCCLLLAKVLALQLLLHKVIYLKNVHLYDVQLREQG